VSGAPDLPSVSVIVPVRDGDGTIAECLDAILATDYPADRREILVVDNGSTDGTAALIQSKPVRYLHESKRGVSNARNRGIAESSGEILAFVDADCLVEPQWLSELVRPFEDPEVGSVGGDLQHVPPPSARPPACSATGSASPSPRIRPTRSQPTRPTGATSSSASATSTRT
jgi:glycosyltransferase involved in cell wall biosynthesis